ncbi:Nuclear polyadenylated RNA-binding protein NAB2 [Zancudomyces culisetae]|nr:Nuclear polyadenylated RNA-binding protein NAB2 [Zancudomyces culisetae]|eukprot:OMH80178.1 Nuclear polyadenylated RNA-binding protein NAB2 [Zancudomyces culisetae]
MGMKHETGGGVLFGTKLIRCTNWPYCKAGNECPYFHPTKMCPKFPNCPKKDNECMYIHPATKPTETKCKFGVNCLNPNCTYEHPPKQQPGAAAISADGSPAAPGLSILCKFYPNCMNPACTFVHPTPKPGQTPPVDGSVVADGVKIMPGSRCSKEHKVPMACRNGATCTRADCRYIHPHEQLEDAKIPCKFGYYCTRMDCAYLHPTRNLTLVNNTTTRADHISERPFVPPEEGGQANNNPDPQTSALLENSQLFLQANNQQNGQTRAVDDVVMNL